MTRLASLLLCAVLLAASCGDSTDEESAEDATPSATVTSETATGTTSPTPTPTPKKRNIIAWILSLGPGAPAGPPEFTAYRELQRLRCAKVFDRIDELDEPAQTLYAGTAQACLAAFEGRAELWPKSEQALDVVRARQGELNCMDRAAFALLERLVSLHEKHPGRAFVKAGSKQSKRPPCPSITALTPDRGQEGTRVRMTGRNLGADVVGISVVDSNGNSLPGEDLTRLDGGLEFTMPEEPPSDASASACIVVRADPDWHADGAMFTYLDGNTGAPQRFACPPPEDR